MLALICHDQHLLSSTYRERSGMNGAPDADGGLPVSWLPREAALPKWDHIEGDGAGGPRTLAYDPQHQTIIMRGQALHTPHLLADQIDQMLG
jgi:hypothetical protein